MSVDGNWNMTMTTPMGERKATLSLTSSGNTLTGTQAGEQGSAQIADGKVDGNKVSWKVSIQNPMPLTLEFTGTVDGNKVRWEFKANYEGNAMNVVYTGTIESPTSMKGTIDFGGAADGTFTAQKDK